MKKLLYIALLVLISCSNPTGTEEFAPYRIGNWMVTSDITANFIGSQFKSKGDTVIVDNTLENYSLQIIENTRYPDRENDFNLIFADSTTTQSDSINTSNIRIDMPSGKAFTSQGRNIKESDIRLLFDAYITYACINPLQASNPTIKIHFWKTGGAHYRSYIFDVDGIFEVLDTFMSVCH